MISTVYVHVETEVKRTEKMSTGSLSSFKSSFSASEKDGRSVSSPMCGPSSSVFVNDNILFRRSKQKKKD